MLCERWQKLSVFHFLEIWLNLEADKMNIHLSSKHYFDLENGGSTSLVEKRYGDLVPLPSVSVKEYIAILISSLDHTYNIVKRITSSIS